ncbi:hypothetical protein ABID21_004868 [Pseudorhizobium tarimense]|uniref:Uncharacterized protein n=1 Tax=Pseudorhizobium tarimense TaxID=1079109 RepID=A0ABV2HDV4_9HYPH|nr:hypothetical protein [Pseudorhizobium tarimense]MCJ8521685.1 hypothetical protein [Pseudorhizobium tarimense]
MSERIDVEQLEENGLRKVWSVSEFAKRYRLERDEETRLLKLLGAFATEQELLMNASRAPRFR